MPPYNETETKNWEEIMNKEWKRLRRIKFVRQKYYLKTEKPKYMPKFIYNWIIDTLLTTK